MELIPTLIVTMLGAVFALAGLVAGTGRAPGGAHAAGSAPGAPQDDSSLGLRFAPPGTD